MNSCRICRTKSNLKYEPAQLATKRKKLNANEKQEIMVATATNFGNICLECEKRLLNFHKLDDQKDLEVDSGREETPVIVDDDDLLYNLFFENSKIQRAKHSLSSDCDTEVVELASSREISPHENVVAVIDLSDDATATKKRKRLKKYDENKLVVLAKLNLISSDSEEDEIYPPARAQKVETQQQTELAEQTTAVDVKCCVCKSVFSGNQELVHHMRSRHRNNEHATQLRERMRHAQDSALTIRLCFKGRFMYYECQLCGRIDGIFKEHKEHVIAKHSPELISLKDPILKRLSCPVCNESCGSHYIEVCRHVLQHHTSAQYKFFLKEILTHKDVDVESVALTARVYQFHLRQNLYFSCRHCQQLNSSIKSHRNHMKDKHQIATNIIEVKVERCSLKLGSLREKRKEEQRIKINLEKIERNKKIRKVGRPRKKSIELNEKKLVKTSAKKGVDNQETKRGRPRRAVKVKPIIRQLAIQTYNCQYCQENFQGFLLWNLHNLKEHGDQVNCDIWKHEKLNTNNNKIVHKRAKRKKAVFMTVDENCNNTKLIENCCMEETKKDDVMPYVPNWLQELLDMHESKIKQRENDNDENKEKSFSSGFMKMRPNTAILEQTPNVRCIRLHNRN